MGEEIFLSQLTCSLNLFEIRKEIKPRFLENTASFSHKIKPCDIASSCQDLSKHRMFK